MEQFEFKVDASTVWIKAINALGFTVLGLSIGLIAFSYKSGEVIDWMNFFMIIVCSVVFGFFPSLPKYPELHFTETGIYLKYYPLFWTEKEEIAWDEISSIQAKKNQILIKYTIGSSQKIQLPIYTKEQVRDMKSYLQKITVDKGIKYLD